MDAFALENLKRAQSDPKRRRIHSHGSLSTDVHGWEHCYFNFLTRAEEKVFERAGPAMGGRGKNAYESFIEHFFY